MSLGCVLLRHDIRPRWIGDLLAAYCHTCGCLYVPAIRHDSQQDSGGRRVATPQPPRASGVLPVALTVIAAATRGG